MEFYNAHETQNQINYYNELKIDIQEIDKYEVAKESLQKLKNFIWIIKQKCLDEGDEKMVIKNTKEFKKQHKLKINPRKFYTNIQVIEEQLFYLFNMVVNLFIVHSYFKMSNGRIIDFLDEKSKKEFFDYILHLKFNGKYEIQYFPTLH
jgi:hypothetical protein